MEQLLRGDDSGIVCAAQLITEGKLVVIPTETVYGLAANAFDADAVSEIFRIKGRPSTNPVIVHIGSPADLQKIAITSPNIMALAEAFWPGPLTIVLQALPTIPKNVTAGGTTVGVRMPDHPVALNLLNRCGLPLAAPSANRSEAISPTSAAAALLSLGVLCPPVLDGGPCRVGIESTVIDMSSEQPTILRPGAISKAQLEQHLRCTVLTSSANATIARSPGQMKRHYSPKTPSILSSSPWELATRSGPNTTVLYHSEIPLCGILSVTAIRLPDDPPGYAAGLYAALTALDQVDAELIVIEHPPLTEEWDAVRDRLNRATAERSED